MWEWEDQDDGGNPEATEASVQMAQQIIDAQKIELERRKEQMIIEEQINDMIDDRIARFDNVIRRSQIEIDMMTKAVAKKQQLVDAEKAAAAAAAAAAADNLFNTSELLMPVELKELIAAVNPATASPAPSPDRRAKTIESFSLATTS